MLVTIDTTLIPQQSFAVSARRNGTDRSERQCPVADPAWLTVLLSSGLNLQLEDVVLQAGRHFSDRVNPGSFAAGASRRELATAIAWTIISLVSPDASTGQLILEDPMDGDIKRLCSEIIGVGLALEVLRKRNAIDGRTIRKIASGFDYEANQPGGGGLVKIEAKGTFSGASLTEHRTSIYNKIVTEGLTRGYDSAIGVIACLWTADDTRGFDLEICDPERVPEGHFEESIREIIRFYARRFEEVVNIEEGTKLLFAAADSSDLFKKLKPPVFPERAFDTRRILLPFRHNAVRLRRSGAVQEFWGRIWEPRKLLVPLPLPTRNPTRARQVFMGIDVAIFGFIQDRNFAGLLAYKADDDGLWWAEDQQLNAIFSVDSYGIVRAVYEGELPPEIEAESR